MTLDAEGTNATARAGLNGQTQRCDHTDLLPAVEPGLPECKECLALGRTWTRLLVCLTCGWVACSDDARGGHAKDHYQETDHPVAATLESRSPICCWRRASTW
ncbi:UBP-type zinc finger domain-containing protein [Nonomuraea sp. H19]|uniref:UBP-type zinc finger domain-containing protein n=1 Tax=Nonomuraea sp. H19 TaxID=3452206 RepID=UPI003F8992DE